MGYLNTTFYKITSKYCKYVFYDFSTNLKNKKYNHKRKTIADVQREPYVTINDYGGWDNWKIEVIETRDCINKSDATAHLNEIKKNGLLPPKTTEIHKNYHQKPPKTTEDPPKTTKNVLEYSETISHANSSRNVCNYCGKHFSRKDTLGKHIRIVCKTKKELDKTEELKAQLEIQNEKNEIFEQQINDMKKQLEMVQNQLVTVPIQTVRRTHRNTRANNENSHNHSNNNNIQNTMQNSQNTTNNTLNNTLNNTNNTNNTINIIELGKENLIDFFTPEQQKQILQKRYACLDFLVESVHFNQKYKQFQNVAITNINNPFAYKFVENEKKFVSVNKDSLLDDIMNYRMEDISEFYENNKDDENIDKKTIDIIKRFIDDMDEDEKRKEKIKGLKLILYNNRNHVDKCTISSKYLKKIQEYQI